MTLDSREGQSVPDVTFKVRRDGHLIDVTSEALFKGRNVVLFALPGAYTPTCSSNHLPRYNELADRFYTSGIDDIVGDAELVDDFVGALMLPKIPAKKLREKLGA